MKYIFVRQLAWLKYFTYHLVPVLAPNCKQYILSSAKVSFFPGTSPLEPVVNPTTQASSLSL
jgi:hypothetical protein